MENDEHALFFQSIVDNVPNMIFVKDAKELRFTIFNKAGEELLGYPKEAMIGKNDYDFFPKEQADFFTAKDRLALENKIMLDIAEEPLQTRDKGVRILHTKKIPILDENGVPKYLLGISEDITEKKKLEEELVKYTKNLEQKVAEQTAVLVDRVKELESLNEVMVGRELKMMDLKKEIDDLKKKSK